MIGIEQMDSKRAFFAPSNVHVNLQCAMLIPSVAYTRYDQGLTPAVCVKLRARSFHCEGPVSV